MANFNPLNEGTSYWHEQCILVTGGNGFLGRHVCDELDRLGAGKVYAPTQSAYNLKLYNETGKLFNHCQPTIVIHLAANVGGIGYNYLYPVELLRDNLLINEMVIHHAYAHEISKFVGIGSVCAYPEHTPTPFREDDLWNGYPEPTNAPYGLAKRMLLAQSQAYRAEYGFNAIHLILANLYGIGDCFDKSRSHVIPAMIRKFTEAKQQGSPIVVLYGDGTPTRDFLFVEDAARAIVKAAEVYNEGEPINIGTGVETSIEILAALIAREVGYAGKIIWDDTKPNGQQRRVLDTTRAREYLDWQAQVGLQEGLRKTIDWYMQEKVVIG